MFDIAGRDLVNAREILDIGCGTGWWLERLAARPDVHAALHAVEILPERAEAAQRRVPGASVLVGDARDIAYGDGRYDVVTLFTVLSSLRSVDVSLALREASRVLGPEGLLLVWEPRVANPLNRSTILIGERALREAFPDARIESQAITLIPPLARHLGSATAALYPQLARFSPLLSHRLWSVRRGTTPQS